MTQERLSATDFAERLKEEKINFEPIVNAWLFGVIKKFNKNGMYFDLPLDVDSDPEKKRLFIEELHKRGFTVSSGVRYDTTGAQTSKPKAIGTISLSIPFEIDQPTKRSTS